jgi:hypothetical protein
MLNLSNKTQAKGFILRGWFKRPVLFVAFLMTLFTATAQQYPVIGTMQLTSPVPVSWVKFTDVLSNKAVLNLTLIDGELGSRNVKLKMYIEKGNTLIATSSDVIANAPALTLVPNILQQVSGIKITPYFQFNNLQGIAQSTYDKQLDEGLYRLTFEVYNSVTNERLSAPIVQDFFITLNNPPTLSQPANGEQVETSASTLVFQWLSQANTSGVLSTIPASQLTLVEVPSGTTDIAALFNVPTPKFTQAVTSPNTSITVIKAALGLIAGRTYAWRVQVVDPLQRNQPNAAFKNYGYSDIFTFTYATACPVVTNLVLEAKSSDVVAATWKQLADHYSYRVAYRKYSTNTIWQWVEVQSANNALNLTGLEAATEYEVRIGGICDGNKVGFGLPVRVTTLAAGQISGLNCSMPNVVAPTGTGIPTLLVGDVITAGDFPVTLTQISGANGNFNGKGWIRVPWLLNIKIAVTFTGLGVNTAKKVTSGFVETVYDPTWGNIVSLDGNPNSQANTAQVVGIIYDCSLKINDLLGLLANGNTQAITAWMANNKDLFNNMVTYLAATSSQSVASQDRLRRIQELVNLLVGQGATPNKANATELARLLEDERIARLLVQAILPDEGVAASVPAARGASTSRTAARLVSDNPLWVTPAGTPFLMETRATDNTFLYCYWDLENKIPKGTLRGFTLSDGKKYAAAFAKSSNGDDYEFLGYYDYNIWTVKGSLEDAPKYIPPTTTTSNPFGIISGSAVANLMTLVPSGENAILQYTTELIKFSPEKAVAIDKLNASNRNLSIDVIQGYKLDMGTVTVVLSCKERLGDESVILINNTGGQISTATIKKFFEGLKFKKIKIGLETEVYFSTIVVANGDGVASDALLANIVSQKPKERVLYLRFDSSNKLVEVKDAYGQNVSSNVKSSLTAIKSYIDIIKVNNFIKNPLEVLADIFRGIGEIIDKAKVPEKYYNVDYTEGGSNKYEPWLFDIWKLTNTVPSSPLSAIRPVLRASLEQAYGIKNKLDNRITIDQVEFAFHCGLWNGLVDQFSLLASMGAMVAGMPETIYSILFNVKEEGDTKGTRDILRDKIEEIEKKAKEAGGSYTNLIINEVSKKMTLNNACKNGHIYGETVTNIVTIFAAFTKIGRASQFFTFLNDLDALSQVLKLSGKVIKAVGTGVKIAGQKGGRLVILVVNATGDVLTDIFYMQKPYAGKMFAIPFLTGNRSNAEGILQILWSKIKTHVIKTDVNGNPLVTENGNNLAELVTTDGEAVLVEVVKDAWKAGLHVNVDGWLTSITNLVKKSQIEGLLADWPTDLLAKLNSDLASTSLGSDLKLLLLENPLDLNDIYRVLKETPALGLKKYKEKLGNWEKWGGYNFFKTCTKEGKDFENWFTEHIGDYEPFKTFLKPIAQGGGGYKELKQIYLKRVTSLKNNTLNIVADNLLVKQATEIVNGQTVTYWRAVINDCKLSLGSPWTDNQRSELIDMFKNVADDSAQDIANGTEKAFIKYEVRSATENIVGRPSNFVVGTEIRIYKRDIYKTISNGAGGCELPSRVIF